MTGNEQTQERPASEPPLTRSERIFVRISVWQTVLSLVGLFVGAVALYAALTESEAVRRQTAASVWPYVQLAVNDYISERDALFELSLTNAGVGPAHISGMRVTIGGERLTTWRDVVRATGGGKNFVFAQNAASNRVIRPGERVVLFGTREPALVEALRAAVSDPSNAIEYCYCSIFDACWVADSRDPDARPAPTAHCPNYGEASFGS